MCRGLGQRGREVEVKVNRHFLFTFYILKTQGTGSVIKNAIGRLYRHRKKADDDKVSVGSGKCFGAVASGYLENRQREAGPRLPRSSPSACQSLFTVQMATCDRRIGTGVERRLIRTNKNMNMNAADKNVPLDDIIDAFHLFHSTNLNATKACYCQYHLEVQTDHKHKPECFRYQHLVSCQKILNSSTCIQYVTLTCKEKHTLT